MKRFLILFMCFFMFGCAHKDPVDSVIDFHQNHIKEVLDYAYNNITQTEDTVFLENELQSCSIAMTDIKQVYYGQIAACKSETNYWKLMSFGLFIALVGALFIIIRRVFK